MLIFLGDIHGNFNSVMNHIEKYDLRDCSIFQVGDFGMCAENIPNAEKLNDFIKKRNIEIFAIRGNHDDPSFFNTENQYFSNITFLKDYDVIERDNKKILGVGGAISLDRIHRIEKNLPYWNDENFVLNVEKISKLRNIDIVITHSAPDFCYPYRISNEIDYYKKLDSNLINDLKKERNDISYFWNILKQNNSPQYYFYGHFHSRFFNRLDECNFILLGINEFYCLN